MELPVLSSESFYTITCKTQLSSKYIDSGKIIRNLCCHDLAADILERHQTFAFNDIGDNTGLPDIAVCYNIAICLDIDGLTWPLFIGKRRRSKC